MRRWILTCFLSFPPSFEIRKLQIKSSAIQRALITKRLNFVHCRCFDLSYCDTFQLETLFLFLLFSSRMKANRTEVWQHAMWSNLTGQPNKIRTQRKGEVDEERGFRILIYRHLFLYLLFTCCRSNQLFQVDESDAVTQARSINDERESESKQWQKPKCIKFSVGKQELEPVKADEWLNSIQDNTPKSIVGIKIN